MGSGVFTDMAVKALFGGPILMGFVLTSGRSGSGCGRVMGKMRGLTSW
jgi:hypothetical protein